MKKTLSLTILAAGLLLASCTGKSAKEQAAQDSTGVEAATPTATKAEDAGDTENVQDEVKTLAMQWVEKEQIFEHLSKEFEEACNSTCYLPWIIMSEGEPYTFKALSATVEEKGNNTYKVTVHASLKWEGEEPTPWDHPLILIQEDGHWVIDDYILPEEGLSVKYEIQHHGYGQTL